MPAHSVSSASRPGIHLLRSRRAIQQLVASSGAGAGRLVLDLGAGPGTLTGPLAETGARVLAIERNPAFLRRLHRRFDGCANVRVVEGDLRDVLLPARPYLVVASIPFGMSTALFRRLLGPLRRSMHGGDVVVEWGFAKRITEPVPRDLDVAWWACRYELEIVSKLPARLFNPEPSVDCAHLRIRPRPGLASAAAGRRLWEILRTAYRGRAPLRTIDEWVALVSGGRNTRPPK